MPQLWCNPKYGSVVPQVLRTQEFAKGCENCTRRPEAHIPRAFVARLTLNVVSWREKPNFGADLAGWVPGSDRIVPQVSSGRHQASILAASTNMIGISS